MIRFIGTWLQQKVDETTSFFKAFFIGALDGLMSFWMVFGAISWFLIIFAGFFGKGKKESND